MKPTTTGQQTAQRPTLGALQSRSQAGLQQGQPRRHPYAHAAFSTSWHSSSLRGNPVLKGSCTNAHRACPRRGSLVISAVFERFTERAIKSVMLAQQEAKMFASSQVQCFCVGTRVPSADGARLTRKLSPIRAIALLNSKSRALQRL